MKMTSNRFLLGVVLLAVLQSSSGVGGKQKSDMQPAKSATVISIGEVTRTLTLVRPDKLSGSARKLPNGQVAVELPRLSEYSVGTIYEFRADEVLKGNKVVEAGQTIKVLVPGPGNVSDIAAPTSTHPYLLQLALLKDDPEKYVGMVVMDFADPSFGKQQFDVHTTYSIVGYPHGAVPVTEENKRIIQSIRRDAAKQ